MAGTFELYLLMLISQRLPVRLSFSVITFELRLHMRELIYYCNLKEGITRDRHQYIRNQILRHLNEIFCLALGRSDRIQTTHRQISKNVSFCGI